MNLIDMFYREIEDAKARKVPLIIPIGTIEYHGEHASVGCDTMVITGVLDRLGKRKEIIVAPRLLHVPHGHLFRRLHAGQGHGHQPVALALVVEHQVDVLPAAVDQGFQDLGDVDLIGVAVHLHAVLFGAAHRVAGHAVPDGRGHDDLLALA